MCLSSRVESTRPSSSPRSGRSRVRTRRPRPRPATRPGTGTGQVASPNRLRDVMETATVAAPGLAAQSSTGSKTCADLAPLAAERHADLQAVTYKDASGQWVSKNYREAGEIVRRLALGLIDLGIERGDK